MSLRPLLQPQPVVLYGGDVDVRELVVEKESSGPNPGIIEVQTSEGIHGLRQVEVVEYAIYGTPTTGGDPNHAYLSIAMGQLKSRAITTAGQPAGFKLLVTGRNTVRSFHDRTIVKSEKSPIGFQSETWRVYRPDGKLAESSDYTRIVLVLRFIVDLKHQQ